ncbi:hydantoinase/oxoprolinase family protein [Methylobacterium platani]|uniref:H4MPT-linked C1 transfer pathway protein n=2 Tax=Methylobacterium platani TaxID=427683 RepID=A0A179SG96_9HYPH|nr:hydantoinase/oxoprolinase family protein [Methylobacterium platani]KMO12177.1 H4MPT-linked C1 transfer pathway protein [Methylobacterium platani JCM 14648]OAS25525.1 H4MPT-linked C1 transfer pathway protein [Methylobacterium platani]
MTHRPSSAPLRRVIGWDLGGVHVKAALVEDGRVRAVVQARCPLWNGLPALDATFAGLPDWVREPARHAVTMTGELTDCFSDRADGVAQLAGWAAGTLPGEVAIYAGRAGLVAPGAAAAQAADVASANWHATAALVGTLRPDALLVDVGSTTADLIPVVGGRPCALGYSDAERLETGELVYTGVVRTPVLALARAAPFRGRRTALMAECFATTADIYRLLGLLPEAEDQQDTADLKGKSICETEIRLARMIGRDRHEGTGGDWTALAGFFAEAQARLLHDAAGLILSRGELPDAAPVVVCGAGRFVAARLAGRLGRPAEDLADLVAPRLAPEAAAFASTCGPALAVGLLAAVPAAG